MKLLCMCARLFLISTLATLLEGTEVEGTPSILKCIKCMRKLWKESGTAKTVLPSMYVAVF